MQAGVQPEVIYGLYCIAPKWLNEHDIQVNGSHHKPLIERRRRHSHDQNELTLQSGPPQNRRAGDQMRIRFQRWIELANVALGKNAAGSKDGHKR